MSPVIAERAFEEAIECGLLQHGPDAVRACGCFALTEPRPASRSLT
jgi:hypothetical protein